MIAQAREALTSQEHERLCTLESTLQRGVKAALAAGQALAEIRDDPRWERIRQRPGLQNVARTPG